jgi:signal transduction histidine kinase
MNELILNFFLIFNSLLGIQKVHPVFTSDWEIIKNWEHNDGNYSFKANNLSLIDTCKDNPTKFIIFPKIIHSYQSVIVDRKIIKQLGDKTFKKANSFYEQMTLSCAELKNAKDLTWEVISYSNFFARIITQPKLHNTDLLPNFFNVTSNIISVGILQVLSLFTFVIYRKRVNTKLTLAVSLGAGLFSLYFLFASSSVFGLNISMLNAHKLSDLGLWSGGGLFLWAFFLEGLMSPIVFYFLVVMFSAGLLLIAMGSTGDIVQLGSLLPLIPFLFAALNILYHLFKATSQHGYKPETLIKFFSISTFLIFGLNDGFNIIGLIDTMMFISIGSVGGVLGLSIAVVQAINLTYQERDDLLAKLEFKVQEKTQHLEEALNQVQATQAELVQSAKLASLGTLSAGIAHEINNSINYVNGALIPLERRVMNYIPEAEKPLIQKLLNAIKEGTHLTVNIVKSLRTYTGLNQAELKEFYMIDAIQSVTTILKTKLNDVTLNIIDPDHVSLQGNLVGFNQIFMNLITNSIDAFDKEQKSITIQLELLANDRVQIKYTDNGPGIPAAVLSRVFDPFFTTKEVGKGTGLGLHIVKSEIEKHQGDIKILSEVGTSTTFLMTLPLCIPEQITSQEVAA